MMHDGLTSTFDGRHMVEQASFVSRELGISREDQDALGASLARAGGGAIDEGRFGEEIVPVGDFDADEAPRRDTSLERLAKSGPSSTRRGRRPPATRPA